MYHGCYGSYFSHLLFKPILGGFTSLNLFLILPFSSAPGHCSPCSSFIKLLGLDLNEIVQFEWELYTCLWCGPPPTSLQLACRRPHFHSWKWNALTMYEATKEALGAVPYLSAIAAFPDSDTEVPDTGLVGARMRHRSPCHMWKPSETQIDSLLELFSIYFNYLEVLESFSQRFFFLCLWYNKWDITSSMAPCRDGLQASRMGLGKTSHWSFLASL